MAESGSVSGFESDAGDVAAVDWTLPRDQEEQGGGAGDGGGADDAGARAAAAAAAAAAHVVSGGGGGGDPDVAATTSTSGDWLDQVSSDGELDDGEEEDEDDEDEDAGDDDDDEDEEESFEEAAGDGDDDGGDGDEEEDDDAAEEPTHARLLRLAYTVGSRLAGAGGTTPAIAATYLTAVAAAESPSAAAALAAAAAAAAEAGAEPPPPPPPPPRRPLQCTVTPLPAPPKPPHPPLLQRLNAAVAGDLVPRGPAGAAALLDRRGGGAPLSACRRALLLQRAEGRGARGSAGGGGGTDDEERDDEEDEEPSSPTMPRRRSARLVAAARRTGGGGAGADADGARDQQDDDQDDEEVAAEEDKRQAAGGRAASPTSTSTSDTSLLTVLNTARLLLKRDLGLGAGAGGSLSRAQRLHASALPPGRALPTVPCRVRDQMASRAYVGQFSADGSLFVAAYQDRRVRLYDVGAPSGGVSADAAAADDEVRGSASSSLAAGGRRPSPRFFTRWRLRKDISTRLTRWTVTDTALSPDGRYLVYSSITPVVWLVDVGAPYDPLRVDSRANETQLHDALSFAGGPPPPPRRAGGQGDDDDDDGDDEGLRAHLSENENHHRRNFGVWSVAWAPGGAGELVAGTSDRSALVYDMGVGRPVARMGGHGDDVNAVAHLDPMSPFLVATGSDDALVRLWDRRVGGGGGGGGGGVASARRAANEQQQPPPSQQQQMSQTSDPVGVWIGHTEGVTHLSPRGDGRVLLSNAKDQTARAWDARSGRRPASEARALPPVRGGRGSGFDYRWEAYPYRGYAVQHPHDASVQVYRGHSVLQSLVRAYWSPEASTGGRYVYAGSADGCCVVWDAATAEVVARLSGAHGAVVRDAAWHPREPAIVTASWDGRLIEWRAPDAG